MRPEFPYTRAAGSRRGLFFSSSLWLGEDHFLVVRNTRFSEAYKRYYYRDVQAILIRKAGRFSVPAYWFLALLAVLAGAVVGASARVPYWAPVTQGVCGALLLWLAYSSFFRSCVCHVKTAVSLDELPSLFRRKPALRAVAQLAQRVEAVQGAVGPEFVLPTADPPMVPPIREPAAMVPPTRRALSIAVVSFILLYVDAVLTYVGGPGTLSRTMEIAAGVFILVETAMLIGSLAVLWPATAARGLRNAVIAGLVFAGLTYYASSLGGQFARAYDQIGQKTAASASIRFRVWVNWLNEGGNLLLGTLGIVMCSRHFARPKE